MKFSYQQFWIITIELLSIDINWINNWWLICSHELTRELKKEVLRNYSGGFSAQDAHHRFVASGNWDLSYTRNSLLRDFQLSSIITLESGQPYNLLAGVDLNMDGDTPFGDHPQGLAGKYMMPLPLLRLLLSSKLLEFHCKRLKILPSDMFAVRSRLSEETCDIYP